MEITVCWTQKTNFRLPRKGAGRDTLGVWDQQTHATTFKIDRDFPGGPVTKTPCLKGSGPGFNLWSGN